MSFTLQIDYYAQGDRVLTLAPGLVILVSDKNRQPASFIELEECCGKCKEHLRTWPRDPALQNELSQLSRAAAVSIPCL